MKVLVVGGGGREHAMIKKLKESPKITELYCAPGNGGIAQDATCVPIKATDVQALTDWAAQHRMDYVVVAPDDPLCLGLVDMLGEQGIPAFGPSKAAARIEGSKVFAKELMRRYHIPTADYSVFTDASEALAYASSAAYPLVIKADGLALGKGVIICESAQEAAKAITEIMTDGKFGAAGKQIVIESFLEGPEVSMLCFTDGTTLRPMVSGMDHKRALDGDNGLNTGGMGVISPNPFYTEEIAAMCMETIFLPTLVAMQKEGCPFQGCLYFGLMLTKSGPMVIEYNCRFGDPETQAVLPLMQSDLLDVMLATTNGTLHEVSCEFSQDACCCVIMASGGYPEAYQTGFPITGLDAAAEDAMIFHAGTTIAASGELVTSGGRVLGVTAAQKTLPDAVRKAYQAAERIAFQDAHKRNDIGFKALKMMH